MADTEPTLPAESVAGGNPVEERFTDIQRRLGMSSYRLQPPTWDDIAFLIEQMGGRRRQADSAPEPKTWLECPACGFLLKRWDDYTEHYEAEHNDGSECGS